MKISNMGQKIKMSRFSEGEIVRVRLDTATPYRGRLGTIFATPINATDFWYIVKFHSRGYDPVYRFVEQDLEISSN
jgi:hypothetical protein